MLGYVGTDDNGLGGLEQKYETRLHGVPGRMYTAMDARRHVLGSSEHEPEPGQNLVLTIDENIQFLAERALDHAMERTQAANGTVVVQDVHTGQILALAIRPTFNPNFSRRTTPELLRNHAVSDVYEPGSVFKLVTYSAALDQHAVTPDDTVDCQGSVMTLAGRVIHDDKGDHFGRLTITEALEHSSNVGAIKTALKVGPERLYQYVRDFGFGQRSGAELPGETRGLLRPVNKWSASSIASIAMGQEVGVTPLQMVSMVSTIANGGVYLPPHVLMPGQVDQATGQPTAMPQASPFKPGGELPNPLPAGAHRVLSTLTAAQMRKMMEGVVLYGTGKQAQLNGYSSGGKTGTAQKIDPATHHLLEDHARGLVCRHRSGEQSGDRRGGGHGQPQGRVLRRQRLRAGLCRGGAAGARVPGSSARHRCALPTPGGQGRRTACGRRAGAQRRYERDVRRGQRFAGRRSTARGARRGSGPVRPASESCCGQGRQYANRCFASQARRSAAQGAHAADDDGGDGQRGQKTARPLAHRPAGAQGH